MKFAPREILFSSSGNCNLACRHCDSKEYKTSLDRASALSFLEECVRCGIKRVGFTGGEPFLNPAFLASVADKARKEGMLFGRIMTNAVWYESGSALKKTLTGLFDAGYDGSICVSFDALHKQSIAKVAHFIKTALAVWRRADVVSIARVTGAFGPATNRKLRGLARMLKAGISNDVNGISFIKTAELFIRIYDIELSPVGAAGKLKSGWGDDRWYKEDYCKGPGNVFYVLPDGKVKPCCGYATSHDALTIGNIIKGDSVNRIIDNARKNRFVNTVFSTGLSAIRRRLAAAGVKFPGKSGNHCFFCHYILSKVPGVILKKCLYIAVIAVLMSSPMTVSAKDGEDVFKLNKIDRAPDLGIRVIRKILLPKGYHEGLFLHGRNIWVNNGKNIATWIVNPASGKVVSKIKPPGQFTEAVSAFRDGELLVTDWDEKKLMRVKMHMGVMTRKAELSLAPAHPAGVVWTGSRIYVITWTRGMGTKFRLLEMDENLNLTRTVAIDRIQEPAHLAWDGKRIWITSWYSKLVYRVDPVKLAIEGSFVSPVSLATGIAWDGACLWLTGTYGDLYQIKVD